MVCYTFSISILGDTSSAYRPIRKKEEKIMCRLRIGHTRLTHSHLLRAENAPKCER